MMQLTDHFHLDEFRCPCCGRVQEQQALMLARRLERARATSGPMTIVSGYRCEDHNALVGGVAGSAHVLGLAVDLAVSTDSARFRILTALIHADFRRLGIGAGIIHADISTLTLPAIWVY